MESEEGPHVDPRLDEIVARMNLSALRTLRRGARLRVLNPATGLLGPDARYFSQSDPAHVAPFILATFRFAGSIRGQEWVGPIPYDDAWSAYRNARAVLTAAPYVHALDDVATRLHRTAPSPEPADYDLEAHVERATENPPQSMWRRFVAFCASVWRRLARFFRREAKQAEE